MQKGKPVILRRTKHGLQNEQVKNDSKQESFLFSIRFDSLRLPAIFKREPIKEIVFVGVYPSSSLVYGFEFEYTEEVEAHYRKEHDADLRDVLCKRTVYA